MRIFEPLPCDIQEQARWGYILSDPEWGAPPTATAVPKMIPSSTSPMRASRKRVTLSGSVSTLGLHQGYWLYGQG